MPTVAAAAAAPPPRVRAPRLPGDPALWLNVHDSPPPLVGGGTALLLDFFTHGCINCQHVLPDLARLQRRFSGAAFAVVGVHSPKFDAEKGTDALRAAVSRLGIAHPVLRDDAHEVRRAFAVRAWPTQVLVDGAGYVVGHWRGEGHAAEIEGVVAALTPCPSPAAGEGGRNRGEPAPAPPSPVFLPSPAVGEGQGVRALRYPGKVLTDPASGRLFVADTGHGRVAVLPPSGGGAARVLGEGGLVAPQGMALSADGTLLYVADAGSHTVRRIDLDAGAVETVAGSGRQALGPVSGGPARRTDLNSPWDLCPSPDGRTLYVAMAGAHQIVAVDLETGALTLFAGTGREGRADGPAREAAFAQPSGIAADGERLFVADAESGCIRRVDTATGHVSTLAGGDLFDFGWRDGRGDDARFQHPLGLAYDREAGFLYVADTYNHRVRRVDPRTGDVTTVAGSGDTADLWEPGGLALAGGRLFVADTNHHRVRTIELGGGPAADLPLAGLCSPTLCFPAGEEPSSAGVQGA